MNLELIRSPREWFDDRSEFAQFGRWLTDTGRTDDLWGVVEKPWKWQPEWQEYQREQVLERYADEMAALEDHRRGPTSDEAA